MKSKIKLLSWSEARWLGRYRLNVGSSQYNQSNNNHWHRTQKDKDGGYSKEDRL